MHKGVFALVSGMRLLLARSELRAVLWRMLGLLLVLMIVLAIGAFWLTATLAERFIPTGDAWYVDMLAWLVWLFSLILALGVAVVSYVMLGSIAASPWLEELCIRAEQAAGVDVTEPHRPWWKSVFSSFWNTLMPLATFLPWAVLAVLLLFVPVYGAVTAGLVWTYAALRLLSFEFMDAPASRRGWQWPQRRDDLSDNKWFYFGFSGLAMLLMVVPVLNLIVLPAAVAGLSKYMPVSSQHDASESEKGQP